MLHRGFSPKVMVQIGPAWDNSENGHSGVAACLSWKMPPTNRGLHFKAEATPHMDYFVQKFEPHYDDTNEFQQSCSNVNRKKMDNVSYRAAGFKMNKELEKGIDEDILLDAIHHIQAEKNEVSNMELKRLVSKYKKDGFNKLKSFNQTNYGNFTKPHMPLNNRLEKQPKTSLISINNKNKCERKPIKQGNKENSILTERLLFHPKILVKNNHRAESPKEQVYDYNRENDNTIYYNYEPYYSSKILEISPCATPVYNDNDLKHSSSNKEYIVYNDEELYPSSNKELLVYTDYKNIPKQLKKIKVPTGNNVSFKTQKKVISDRKSSVINTNKESPSDENIIDTSWKKYPTFYNGYAKTDEKKIKSTGSKHNYPLKSSNDVSNMTVKVDCPNNPLSCITVRLDTPRGLHGKKYVVNKLINR